MSFFNIINNFYGIKDIIYIAMHGVFTIFQSQAFMPHAFQYFNFFTQLFICKPASFYFMFMGITAVGTAIYAVIGNIKWGKNNHPFAVNMVFDGFGSFVHFV